MAFKLTAADLKQRDELLKAVRSHEANLNRAIDNFNGEMGRAKDALTDASDEFNGAVSDLRNFIEQKHDEFENEYNDKSEKWQESERGGATAEWISTFASIEIEETDFDLPDEIATIDTDLSEVENLESEPSY